MSSRIGVFTIAALLIWTCCVHSSEPSGDFESVVALRTEGKNRDAVKALRRVLAESPRHVKALVQLGAVFQDQGDVKQAEAAYRMALEIDPANASARRNIEHLVSSRLLNIPTTDRNPSQRFLIQRGLSAVKERRFHDALVTFRVLSALSPSEWDWVFYSARALEGLEKRREAARLYHMILEAEPAYAAAWVNLIVSLIESGDKDQAAHLTESALREVPNDHRIRYLARRLGIKTSHQSAAGKAPTHSATNARR